MSKIRKAVIPVGGMGSRFLPVTKAVPKEMLPIVDTPTLEYILKEAVDSGIEEVLLINTYGKQAIETYLVPDLIIIDENNKNLFKLDQLNSILAKLKIYILYQKKPYGNGQAMLEAESFVNGEDFAVMWGDDLIKSEVPALKQLIDMHDTFNCNVIGVQKVKENEVSKYGIVKFKNADSLELDSIIEKPALSSAPSLYAGLGRYIVSSKVFNELRNVKKEQGEFYFTEALAKVMKYEKTCACIFDGKYYDIGSQLGYIIANIEYGLNRDDIKEQLKKYLIEYKEN